MRFFVFALSLFFYLSSPASLAPTFLPVDVCRGLDGAEHLTPLENSILKLSENLHQVRDAQEYIKVRERTCRNSTCPLPPAPLTSCSAAAPAPAHCCVLYVAAAESTNERVMWWSIAETIV